MNKSTISRVFSLAVWAIAFLGLYGTIGLVNEELSFGNVCPKILDIPACYIILACLGLVLVSHSGIFKDRYIGYFFGGVIAFSIELFGTISNYFDYIKCPISESGIPMCYLSLILFSSLLLLKGIELFGAKKNQT